jgi:hypothetical protein
MGINSGLKALNEAVQFSEREFSGFYRGTVYVFALQNCYAE